MKQGEATMTSEPAPNETDETLTLMRRMQPLAERLGFQELAEELRACIAAVDRGEGARMSPALMASTNAFIDFLVKGSNESAQLYLEMIEGIHTPDGRVIRFTGKYKNGQKVFRVDGPSMLQRLWKRSRSARRMPQWGVRQQGKHLRLLGSRISRQSTSK
jgi:hypothetical protein